MNTTEPRTAPRVTTADPGIQAEPSHIHIPRPSRVSPSMAGDSDVQPRVPVRLELAVDKAA
jgi:hypothetical protein